MSPLDAEDHVTAPPAGSIASTDLAVADLLGRLRAIADSLSDTLWQMERQLRRDDVPF